MALLQVEAINPVLTTTGWRSMLWLIRGADWNLTCGFCRTRFHTIAYLGAMSIDCPECGTRNRLSSAGWAWRGPRGPR